MPAKKLNFDNMLWSRPLLLKNIARRMGLDLRTALSLNDSWALYQLSGDVNVSQSSFRDR